jgi:hypothetical protein
MEVDIIIIITACDVVNTLFVTFVRTTGIFPHGSNFKTALGIHPLLDNTGWAERSATFTPGA